MWPVWIVSRARGRDPSLVMMALGRTWALRFYSCLYSRSILASRHCGLIDESGYIHPLGTGLHGRGDDLPLLEGENPRIDAWYTRDERCLPTARSFFLVSAPTSYSFLQMWVSVSLPSNLDLRSER